MGNKKTVHLKVTPQHGVITVVNKEKQIQLASSIKVNDTMINSEGALMKVIEVSSFIGEDKYTLETTHGSVIASGVFVTTFCDQNIENYEGNYEQKMTEWRQVHNFADEIISAVVDYYVPQQT